MKLPNGYGSVYKLSGKRRKPYAARKTVGWKFLDKTTKEEVKEPDPSNMQNIGCYPIYEFIGYYETRAEALTALSDYNKDPYDLNSSKVTFAELYERWSEVHFEKVSESNVKGYKAAYKLCSSLENMKVNDITIDHMQKVVDESGKNTPTLKKVKILFGLMYDYAVLHDIVTQDKRDKIRYLDINKAGNPDARNRRPFKKTEIKTVWKWNDTNEYFSIILMLIYSGVRISELLDLKKENVNLEEKWFDVTASKTQAGIRKVPINDKVLPFFQEWMDKNDCEYLLSTPDAKHFDYRNYYDSYWTPLMNQMGLDSELTPHCTRHTCISLLTAKGVDERIIKKIVGHKGQGVTQTVYTHFEIDELLDAINQI